MPDVPDNDLAGVRVLEAAYKRWAKMPPVTATLDRQDAFSAIMGIQAAMTHPDIPPFLTSRMESAGRAIQEAVCDDPELYAIAESGWHREWDVVQAEGGDGA